MRLDRPLLLLLAALTAGCADPEPFIDFGSSTSPTMSKPRDPVLTHGAVALCFSDATPWAEVEELARQACANHGLQIHSHSVTRWQCRATSPHSASFRCYDPEMVLPDGNPVNPFDAQDVARWEKLTGKMAKPHNALTARGGAASPAAPAASAPADAPPAPAAITAAPPAPAPVAPAPPAPAAPLSPADIAGKPPMPPRPDLTPPPAAPAPAPAQGAYPTTDGFTLPQGSWGDHFQE